MKPLEEGEKAREKREEEREGGKGDEDLSRGMRKTRNTAISYANM